MRIYLSANLHCCRKGLSHLRQDHPSQSPDSQGCPEDHLDPLLQQASYETFLPSRLLTKNTTRIMNFGWQRSLPYYTLTKPGGTSINKAPTKKPPQLLSPPKHLNFANEMCPWIFIPDSSEVSSKCITITARNCKGRMPGSL